VVAANDGEMTGERVASSLPKWCPARIPRAAGLLICVHWSAAPSPVQFGSEAALTSPDRPKEALFHVTWTKNTF
jgi:hypothetical protein